MATVSAEIIRLLRDRDSRILSGAQALRGLLTEVKGQIVGELRAVTGESYSALYLRRNLKSIEGYLAGFESAGTAEMARLLDAAWDEGGDLPFAALRAGGLGYGFGHLPATVLETLREYSFHKISGLASSAFDKIRGELSLGVLGQKTPSQVVDAISGSLTSPGVFRSIEERAEVIATTEMGRVFSTATQEGMTQASRSVPGLKKQWWHAGHPSMPRQSHLALHGQIKPVAEPFMTGSLVMMFPRDPKAPASEVIRCGCDHVPWHDNWNRDFQALPIFNQRGEEIARRGPLSGKDPILTGKFDLGRLRPGATQGSKKP